MFSSTVGHMFSSHTGPLVQLCHTRTCLGLLLGHMFSSPTGSKVQLQHRNTCSALPVGTCSALHMFSSAIEAHVQLYRWGTCSALTQGHIFGSHTLVHLKLGRESSWSEHMFRMGSRASSVGPDVQ
jgi:hypothetical protein